MTSLVNLFLIYIFNPVLSIYHAIKLKESHAIRVVFLITFFLIGFTFHFESTGADIARVVDMFKYYHAFSFDSVRMSLFEYFIYDTSKPWEFLLPVICKLVSILTGDLHLFIASLSLIYGYFYIEIFIYILNKLKNIDPKTKSLVLLLYVFTISPYAFQAFRFWTAAIVFVWAFIGYYLENKKSRLIVMFIFCFLHNALFLPVILIFLNNYNFLSMKFLFRLYCVSLIVVIFQIKMDSILAQVMPSFLSDRSSAYLDPEKNGDGDGVEVSSWFLVLSRTAIKYVIFIFNYLLYQNFYKKIQEDPQDVLILKYFFLFFSFSNFVLNSEAYRYSIICADLSFVVFAYLTFEYNPVEEIQPLIKFLTKQIYLFLIFYYVIQFRIFADFCSVYLFVLSPLTHFFVEEQATFFQWYSDLMK